MPTLYYALLQTCDDDVMTMYVLMMGTCDEGVMTMYTLMMGMCLSDGFNLAAA